MCMCQNSGKSCHCGSGKCGCGPQCGCPKECKESRKDEKSSVGSSQNNRKSYDQE